LLTTALLNEALPVPVSFVELEIPVLVSLDERELPVPAIFVLVELARWLTEVTRPEEPEPVRYFDAVPLPAKP